MVYEDNKSDKNKPNALMLASVASMIDLFNTENIKILRSYYCKVDVVANFQEGSITSQARVDEYKKELQCQGIGVYDIPIPRSVFQIKKIVSSYKKIKQLVNKHNYRIVHCHSPIGGVIARIACKNERKKGTRIIYTGHGLHFYKGAPLINWILFYPIERYCAVLTDIFIVINQEDYHRVRSWNACRVEYVPGIGIDTNAFKQITIDRDSMRKEFGFMKNDFVFMSTGQLSIRKNHEVIIRALAKIKDENIKYLIVGFGELEVKLRDLAKELNIEKRVVFAGYRSDVRYLLHIVDAFAFPSLQEGLPVALMEAMSVGLPILCSRIRGNIDLIEDGKGGYIYGCHDITGFAEGMNKIVYGNDARQMGAINMDVMKRFDKAVVNQCMEKIYREQLGITI